MRHLICGRESGHYHLCCNKQQVSVHAHHYVIEDHTCTHLASKRESPDTWINTYEGVSKRRGSKKKKKKTYYDIDILYIAQAVSKDIKGNRATKTMKELI